MAKQANIRLFWSRSASANATKIKMSLTIDGTNTVLDLPVETEEFNIVVGANKSFAYTIETFDSDGLSTTSQGFSMTLGDLTAPLPATGLGAVIVSIDDVPDGGGTGDGTTPAGTTRRRHSG